MIDEIMSELGTENDNTIEALRKELLKVRTGRAHIGILDGIRVDYYGQSSPVDQVASVSVPDPRQILIKPWDKSLMGAIERAVQQADIGLNPTSDGEGIRLYVPALTTERRTEMVRLVHRYGEEAKVGIRGHRRDANELLKIAEKDGDLPKDDCHRALRQVQEATDAYVAKVDSLLATKEKDVMED